VKRYLDGVIAAFQLLLEEMDKEIDFVKRSGHEALEKSDFVSLEQATQLAKHLTQVRERVTALKEEWLRGSAQSLAVGRRSEKVRQKTRYSRIPGGKALPQQAYYRPILEILDSMGGSARSRDVLDRLEEKMRSMLKDVDYEELPSGEPRWYKQANWARFKLVEMGLMKKGSPSGVWEISLEGREWLKGQGN
jgi:hypothetical protein